MTKADMLIVIGITAAVDFVAFLFALAHYPDIQPLGWLMFLSWPTVATVCIVSGLLIRRRNSN